MSNSNRIEGCEIVLPYIMVGDRIRSVVKESVRNVDVVNQREGYVDAIDGKSLITTNGGRISDGRPGEVFYLVEDVTLDAIQDKLDSFPFETIVSCVTTADNEFYVAVKNAEGWGVVAGDYGWRTGRLSIRQFIRDSGDQFEVIKLG